MFRTRSQRPLPALPACLSDAIETSSILTDIISISPSTSGHQSEIEATSVFRVDRSEPENEAPILAKLPSKDEATRSADDLLAQVDVLRDSAHAAKARRPRFRNNYESCDQPNCGEASIKDPPVPVALSPNISAGRSEEELSFTLDVDVDEMSSTNIGYDDQEQSEVHDRSGIQYYCFPTSTPCEKVHPPKRVRRFFGGSLVLFKRLFCFAPPLATAERTQPPRSPPAQFDAYRIRTDALPIEPTSAQIRIRAYVRPSALDIV